MKHKHVDYKIVSYSKARRFMAAARRSVQRTPRMHGLIEVDVTRAHAFLREHKAKTREALSFTAFIIACVAKAVDENKSVQASRKGRKHLILFDDVDVLTYIERDVAGQTQIMPYIIRAANRKTFREIHHEIRAAQVQDVAKAVVGFKMDREQVSTDVEEVQVDGGTHSGWYVWEREQLGHPSRLHNTQYYRGWYWRETRGRGRAHRSAGISEHDDQF